LAACFCFGFSCEYAIPTFELPATSYLQQCAATDANSALCERKANITTGNAVEAGAKVVFVVKNVFQFAPAITVRSAASSAGASAIGGCFGGIQCISRREI
jgi:hypothetical protein